MFQVPEKRVDAFAPLLLLGITVPEIAILGAAAILVYAGITFATDADARKGAQSFWATESARVGANVQTLGAAIGGFAQDVGSNFVRVSNSAWDMVRGYGAEQVTADMTAYTPPLIYDEPNGTVLLNDGSMVSIVTGIFDVDGAADVTFQFGTDTVVAAIGSYLYGGVRFDTNLGWMHYNGIALTTTTNGYPHFAMLGGMTELSTVMLKCVMLGTSIKVFFYGDLQGGAVSYDWYELGHAVNTVSIGADTQSINATAYPQAITNNYTEIQNITTGERSVSATQSLAGVRADALAAATTDAMGLTLPATMTAPLDWDHFKGLTLPQAIATKFPFSIPWDIKNAIEKLATPLIVPVFRIPFHIESIHYDEDVVIDFEQFSGLATLSRYMILFLFMLFIVYETKNLIGGSG
jgi:hypothetical protein